MGSCSKITLKYLYVEKRVDDMFIFYSISVIIQTIGLEIHTLIVDCHAPALGLISWDSIIDMGHHPFFQLIDMGHHPFFQLIDMGHHPFF